MKKDRIKILIVEDDEGLNILIQKTLKKEGLNAFGVKSGKEAISWIMRNENSLVLLDYKLPDMNAQEIIEKLNIKKCQFNFIIITGQGDEKIAVEMMKLGARDYIIKNVDFLSLIQAIVIRVVNDIHKEEKLSETETLLVESEEKYRLFVQNFSGIAFKSRTDFSAIFIHGAVKKITGYNESDFIKGKPRWDQIIHPDDLSRIKKTSEKAKKAPNFSEEKEYRIIHKNGEVRWVHEMIQYIYDESNKPIFAQGTIFDIEKRKKAEEELYRSEERYRTMIENSNDLIWILDKKGLFVYSNEKAEKLYGAKLKDWIGKSFVPMIHPKDLPRMYKIFSETLKGKPQQYEVTVYRKDKKSFVLSVNTTPVYESGEIVGVVSFGRDITERKKAEEALASEKERLSVTLSSISDGVIATDINGKVMLINKVAEKLAGWSSQKALGNSLEEIYCTFNEGDYKACKSPAKQVIKKKIVIGPDYNKILVSKDGIERFIADSAAPIHDKSGKIIGIVLVFRDITEKRKLEEEVQKKHKLESLGLLAGGIAHDFNNIITAILGNISLAMLKYDSVDETHQILSDAEKAVKQAKDLAKQLLTFARGGEPIKKKISISDLIKDSSSFVLRGSNVQCRLEIEEDIYTVDIDEGQMSQVINNLIINADQAMPDGGEINISAENIVLKKPKPIPLPDGKYIMISIKDKGIGISEDHLHKVFDPYFTTKHKGNGLGLTTSYSIVRRHDGYIAVESELTKGTTFNIYLPASRRGSHKKREKIEKIEKGKERILIMDDEEIVRNVVGRMLKHLGYKVEFASEGDEALKLYKKSLDSDKLYDVVIMDLTIPGKKGGKKTVKELLDMNPKAKVIVSSGYSNDPVLANYKKHGFCDFISKPYRIEELSNVLRRVIENK